MFEVMLHYQAECIMIRNAAAVNFFLAVHAIAVIAFR